MSKEDTLLFHPIAVTENIGAVYWLLVQSMGKYSTVLNKQGGPNSRGESWNFNKRESKQVCVCVCGGKL